MLKAVGVGYNRVLMSHVQCMHFVHCRYTGLHFVHCRYPGLHFMHCSYTGLHFVHCRYTGLYFVHCRYTGLHFVHCRYPGLHFVHCKYTGLHFVHCRYPGLHFVHCRYTGLHFVHCRYTGLHVFSVFFRILFLSKINVLLNHVVSSGVAWSNVCYTHITVGPTCKRKYMLGSSSSRCMIVYGNKLKILHPHSPRNCLSINNILYKKCIDVYIKRSITCSPKKMWK
jgi:hypothetical protein